MFILKLKSDTSGTQLFHYTNFFKVMLWYTQYSIQTLCKGGSVASLISKVYVKD